MTLAKKPLAIGVATLVRIAGTRDGEHRPGVARARRRGAAGRRGRGRATAPWKPTAAKTTRETHDGDGGAVGAEPEAEDQERIEHRGDDRRRQRDVHGALGVADGAQHAREAHAERHQHVRGQRDPEEALGDAAASRRSRRAARRSSGRSGRSTSATTQRRRAPCAAQRGAGEPARPARSPAPSARETSAPTAIISPTLIEIARNRTMVARPTPAVRRRIAEPGDVEQRQEVDDEDGDEADRARRRHHDDVAHGRAGDEARPRRRRRRARRLADAAASLGRSSSPMMSRVSGSAPCALPAGSVSGSRLETRAVQRGRRRP